MTGHYRHLLFQAGMLAVQVVILWVSPATPLWGVTISVLCMWGAIILAMTDPRAIRKGGE